jgi:Methyltransferase domain
MEANFDGVARPYRWMEYVSFGRALERCRETFLPRLTDCKNALVLGDGDGRFLARLLEMNTDIYADAVDSSGVMLRLLEQRAGKNAGRRLRTHRANALEFVLEGTYDLVVTHFFLDCFTQVEVESLCARIAGHLQAGSLWVISDFRIPAGVMRWPARGVVRGLYAAFRMLTGLRTTSLPDHGAALAAAGMKRVAERLWLGGMLTSELWEYTPAMLPPQRPKNAHIPDPVPDPEPASPSLPGPDPGVFHHEPGTPHSGKAEEGNSE